MELLGARWRKKRFLCVGLDSDKEKLPPLTWRPGQMAREAQFIFNKAIIDATHDLVCAYKPNIAFYEAEGYDGLYALERTIEYIHEYYPEIPVILDAKRGDVGLTSRKYAKMVFEWLKADAVTVSPYLGRDALLPFLERRDKGIFILCRTSNPGAIEFQDFTRRWMREGVECAEPLYEWIARKVACVWNTKGNCGLVVGATYPKELERIRAVTCDIPLLIPGVGSQGGNIEEAVKAGRDKNGQGFIINASSSIIFASSRSDYPKAARQEAQRLHKAIGAALKGATERKGGK